MIREMSTAQVLFGILGLALGVLGITALVRQRPVVGTVLVVVALLAGPGAVVLLRSGT